MTRIRLMGVPLDFGASRRGVEMGPAALRIAEIALADPPSACELGDAVNSTIVPSLPTPRSDSMSSPRTGIASA